MHLFSRQGILQRKYEKLFHLLLLFFLTIPAQAGEKTFSAGDWSFTCDSENGYWKELKWKGVTLSNNPGNFAPFMWGPEWPTGKTPGKPNLFQNPVSSFPDSYAKKAGKPDTLRLKRHTWKATDSTLQLEYEIGPYAVTDTLQFGTSKDSDLLVRTWDLTLKSGPRSIFQFVQLNMPLPDGGKYFFPGGLRYPKNTRINPVSGLGKNGREEISAFSTLPMLLEQNGVCSILFGDPLKDKSNLQIVRVNGAAVIQYNFKSYGYLEAGKSQRIGPAYFKPARKTIDEQMKTGIRELYREVGLTFPKDRPDWLKDAIIFNASVGGSSYSKALTLGGFHAARTELLPRLRSLGFNTVWFRPIEEVSQYHPRDYFKVNPEYGTAEEFRELVRAAHDSGMKVMLGIVPHGRNAAAGAIRGNPPEALIFDRNGNVPRYLAFDYKSPQWQEYMKKVARFFASEYGVDGLRIDLADGSNPNWRTDDFPRPGTVPANVPEAWWKAELAKRNGKLDPIPYMRPSLSRRQGGLEISHAIRAGLRSVKPEGAVLGEVQYAPYMTENDVIYDKEFCDYFLRGVSWCTPLSKDNKGFWVQSLANRLEQQGYVEPADTLRLRFTETHDYTKTTQVVGIGAARAATALTFVLDGIPMVLQDFDEGNGEFLRRLVTARKLLPELRRGSIRYLQKDLSSKDVFGCLRTTGEYTTLCLINFTADPRTVQVNLPGDLPIEGSLFHDAFTAKTLPATQKPQIRLRPYEAKILALRKPSEAPGFPVSLSRQESAPVKGSVKFARNEWGSPVITGTTYSMHLSNSTGMLIRFTDRNGNILLDDSRFLKQEPFLERRTSNPKIRWNGRERKTPFGWILSGTVTLPEGDRIVMEWSFYPDHVEVKTRPLSDSGKHRDLALAFTRRNIVRYQVSTAEGILDDDFRTRGEEGTPGNLNRTSYRFYGTPILWQSEEIPLDFRRPVIGGFQKNCGVFVGLKNPLTSHPVNAMLLDRVNGKSNWCAAFFYKDSEAGEAAERFVGTGGFTVTLTPANAPLSPAEDNPLIRTGKVSIRNLSYGWLVRGPGYEVELSRTGGSILRWSKGNRRLLSDGGLISENGKYAQDKDYEASVRIRREGDSLKMLFSGVFKDNLRNPTGRKMQTPLLRYSMQYTFDASGTLRLDCAVRSDGKRRSPVTVAWSATSPNPKAVRLQGAETSWKPTRCERNRLLQEIPELSSETLSDGKWHFFRFQLQAHER